MTLVVVVPTSNGAVVASDARMTIDNEFSDGHQKLVQVAAAPRSACFFTGCAASPIGRRNADETIHQFINRAEYRFDLRLVARNALLAAARTIDDALFENIKASCIEAIYGAPSADGRAIAGLGQNFAILGAVVFDRSNGTTTRYLAKLSASEDGMLSASETELVAHHLADEMCPEVIGEGDYFERHVMTASDRFKPVTIRAFSEPRLVIGDVSANQGTKIAEDIIRLASERTLEIPASTGIGGTPFVSILR